MTVESVFFTAADGKKLFMQKFLPDKAPVAFIQISHGMCEYSGTYTEFIEAMIQEGFAVIIHDQRGHGKTAVSDDELGHLPLNQGWEQAVDDLLLISRSVDGGKPLFLLGHSMGSLISRRAAQIDGKLYAGLILSGTIGSPGLSGRLGRWLAFAEGKMRGTEARSPLMNSLAFGRFNAPFQPARTDFSWLSSDEEQVDRYINDPLCGYICTTSFYHELLKGLILVNKNEEFKKTPHNLPVYLVSGRRDPAGEMGKGVERVYRAYKKAGIEDITMELYPNGRHEMLHEVNREEVYGKVAGWIKERL